MPPRKVRQKSFADCRYPSQSTQSADLDCGYATGTIPWFYNQVLPMGEPAIMGVTRAVYFSVNK
jgi:hypothetical protein